MSSLGYCVRFIRKDGAVPDTENYSIGIRQTLLNTCRCSVIWMMLI